MNRLLTVNEAAAICRCHPRTMRIWIHGGKLRSIKAGARHLISPVELALFLAGTGTELDVDQAAQINTAIADER